MQERYRDKNVVLLLSSSKDSFIDNIIKIVDYINI